MTRILDQYDEKVTNTCQQPVRFHWSYCSNDRVITNRLWRKYDTTPWKPSRSVSCWYVVSRAFCNTMLL